METHSTRSAKYSDLSPTIIEIGEKLFPKRYRRFKDLRPYQEACGWADKLDWLNNPYDRFLLRREILRQLESTTSEPHRNIFAFASRQEIKAKVDEAFVDYPTRFGEASGSALYQYCLIVLPFG